MAWTTKSLHSQLDISKIMTSVVPDQSKSSDDVLLELEYEIEEDVEAELQEFVRLSHTGQFADAHELFDDCLSSHVDWFPVTAEYADCLLRQGKFEELAEFGKKASMMFQDPSENALLELMLMIGSCLPRDLMCRRLQYVWPDLSLKPPYTSLRDVDIHLLELVLQILVSARISPENLFPEYLLHDTTSEGSISAGPWDAFKDWLHYLLCREYLWEAQRILQSLMHELPQLEYRTLVQDYIAQAVTTNVSHESIEIAVSSLVQHFVYFSRSTHFNPLAAVQWNDDITSALFGVDLTKTDEMSTSQFSLSCLRRSIEEELDLNSPLPLGGVNDDGTMDDLLHEAALNEDTAVKLAINAGPSLYALDELNRWKHSSSVLIRLRDVLPYLNTNMVDARDGYQRTLLHWASLKGQGDVVKALLNSADTDTCSLDWFGYTPLHYAVKYCAPGSTTNHVQIVESLLMYDSASVDTKDPSGQTVLRMAIQNGSFDVAKLLLLHDAIIETSDYGELLMLSSLDEIATWKSLLSKFDDSADVPVELFEESIYRGAPLTYPGAIQLDTGAALILRLLPPQTTAKDLRPLFAFLEYDYSNSAFPAFQRGLYRPGDLILLAGAARSERAGEMVEPESSQRMVWRAREGREDVILGWGSGL